MSGPGTAGEARTSAGAATVHYVLRLYVTGATAASQRAIANLGILCEEVLPGRSTIEVVDLYERPERAAKDDVLATPTLVRLYPEPVTRVIGDLSDRSRVLAGLGITPSGPGVVLGPASPGPAPSDGGRR